MKSMRAFIAAVAVLAVGLVPVALCQDQDSADTHHQYSLAEAAAAHYGITVSIVVTTWDDIPLIPFPTGFQEDADPFSLISFTSPNILRVAHGDELERLYSRSRFWLW